MAEQLSDRITKLQALLAEAHRRFVSSKQCAGCAFLDRALKLRFSDTDDSSTGDNSFSSYTRRGNSKEQEDIVGVCKLISKAIECRGMSPAFATKTEETTAARTNLFPKNRSCQTNDDPRSIDSTDDDGHDHHHNNNDASSQTYISASYYDEIDRFRRWVKANEACYTRWSFEQLFKFSATEKERENTNSMLVFAKSMLQMQSCEFDDYYNAYMSGTSLKKLIQQRMTESKKSKNLESGEGTTDNQKNPTDDDGKKLTCIDASKNVATAEEQVQILSGQLNYAKSIIMEMFNFMIYAADGIESAEDGAVVLLGKVTEYREILNSGGGRKSA